MQRHGLLVLPNHACQIANSTSMLLLSREIETLYNVFNVNIEQIDASDVNTTVARLTASTAVPNFLAPPYINHADAACCLLR